MALGAIADDAGAVCCCAPGKIDADGDAFAHHGFGAIDQALARVQRAQCLAVEHRIAVTKTDLRQPRAFAHQHRESLRADLGIERTAITAFDPIEAACLVGDHARENVEPSGRAFRIGDGRNLRRQIEAFDQRHDIDAAGFQDGAVGEREFVQLQFGDAARDRAARPRQETRAHPIGDGAEAQVQARRLDLIGGELPGGGNPARLRQRRDQAVGKNALVSGRKGKRHAITAIKPMAGLTERRQQRIERRYPVVI